MACGGQDELDVWAEEFSIQKSTVESLRQEEYELRDVLDLTETDIQALNGGQGLKGGPKRRLLEAIRKSKEPQLGGRAINSLCNVTMIVMLFDFANRTCTNTNSM